MRDHAPAKQESRLDASLMRRRFMLLLSSLTVVALAACAVCVGLLYRANVQQQEERLLELAQAQARVILWQRLAGRTSVGPTPLQNSFGATGRFVVVRGEAGGFADPVSGRAIPVPSPQIEALFVRALSGTSGTLPAADEQGRPILAAYTFIPELGWGMVASIELAEIRAPFVYAAASTLVVAMIIILAGATLIWAVSRPLVERIEENEARHRHILDTVEDIIYRASFDTERKTVRLEFISERVRAILGYAPEELTGGPESWLPLIHPQDLPRVEAKIRFMLDSGAVQPLEFRVRHKYTGGYLWFEDKVVLTKDGQGKADGLLGAARDVTERKEAEARLQMLSGALEQTADGVMITDRDGIIEYVNPAFEEMTGYSRTESLGKKPDILKSGMQSREFYERVWATVSAGDVFKDVFINRRKSGEFYFEEKTISPLKDAQGRITHYIATGKDISERVATQERLQYLAHHDALTELPNRVLFLDRLKQAMALGRRYNRLVAVMFLDLDNFKRVNDTLGHQAGDRLLLAAAERLSKCVRSRDTVARLGGDEFAIILEEVASVDDVSPIAEKVLEGLSMSFEVDGRTVDISTSIGISLFPNDGTDFQTLLRNADAAMYRAKQQGRNNYQFYTPAYVARNFPRSTLETNLRLALERNEFFVCYQALVDTYDEKAVGVEALLRWQHPRLGEIMPEKFIPLLEDSGLILPVEEWVLQTACAQHKAWRKQGLDSLKIAVNLSAHQFHRKDLVDSVRRVLSDTGMEPRLLKLEITEGMLLHHGEATMDTLRALHELGVEVCIDDFGTGYSALSYLKKFAVSSIKIDRSFVQDVATDSDSASITAAIIALGHSLRLQVIAEGAETAEQVRLLREQGCDELQGFYYSRPVRADAFAQWWLERRAA